MIRIWTTDTHASIDTKSTETTYKGYHRQRKVEERPEGGLEPAETIRCPPASACAYLKHAIEDLEVKANTERL